MENLTSWRICLFGGLRVSRGDAVVERFATRKAAQLLAILALEPGPQERDILAARLWPDADSYSGRERLRQALAALRRELAPLGPAPVLGEGRATLQLDPAVATDLKEFEAAAKAARRAATDSDRLICLRKAITLVSGPVMSELDDPRINAERERLASEAIRLVRQAVLLLENRGETEAALEVAYQGLEADRTREESVQTLVELLARLGQGEAARRQYERLEEALGCRPGFTLPETAPAPAFAPVPAVPPGKRRVHLPAALTPIYGREQELSVLSDLLTSGQTRLVTLLGPGGVGKTRLALETARLVEEAYNGAVWFVPLVSVFSPAGILPAVATAVEGGVPASADAEEMLLRRLSEMRTALLVLDNMEQVADLAGPVIRDLLERLPELSLLVTTRSPLGVRGEVRYEVPPLPLPESEADLPTNPAVQCFVHQAQATNHSFRLTPENAGSILKICRQLDGLPLALELAASWAPTLTPQQIALRLQDPLELLVRRKSDGDNRHLTLRGTVETSFRLMTPELQDAFGMLSVFRGGWSLEAAEGVLGASGAILLAELRDRSLLSAFEVQDGENTVMRYQLLETLREFADSTLEDDRREATRRRHARYFTAQIRDACQRFMGAGSDPRPLRILEAEMGNVASAIEFAISHPDPGILKLGVDAIAALAVTWTRRPLNYITPWLERLRERLPTIPDSILGPALRTAGMLGPAEAAAENLRQAQAWFARHGDRRGEADTLHDLANWYLYMNQIDQAIETMRQALALFTEIRYEFGRKVALSSVAGMLRNQGRVDEAVPLWQELYTGARAEGDEHVQAKVGLDLATVAYRAGDLPTAERLIADSIAIFDHRGEKWNLASSYQTLAGARYHTRDIEAAIACLQTAAGILEEGGYQDDSARIYETIQRYNQQLKTIT